MVRLLSSFVASYCLLGSFSVDLFFLGDCYNFHCFGLIN